MVDRNGSRPLQISLDSPTHGYDESHDAIVSDLGKLSPESREKMRLVLQKVSSGEASLAKDKQGNPIIEYKNHRDISTLNYVDQSEAGRIVVPKSEADLCNRMEVLLSLVDFIKSNKAPRGVVFDKTKAQPTKTGHYREDKEYTKLKETLGSGAMAGDIVVVRDSKTGIEHAQKTVMISQFRSEEVRAWIDLDEDGLCPSLYTFYLKDTELVFHMEKLEKAVTLQDIINEHMYNIRQKEPHLVRPFSLYMLHGLLSAVDVMHSKNWNHRDLHGGNVMVQDKGQGLMIKVLDFGKANPLHDLGRPEVLDLRGEQDDIYQVVRLFTGLYLGQEFDSVYDLKQNYKEYFKEIAHLSEEDKTEVFQLVEAVMRVAETGENMKDTIRDIGDKMGGQDEIDLMMKKVVAILFDEKEYMSLHDEIEVKSDGPQDEFDAPFDLNHRARCVSDDFLQKLRRGIQPSNM